MENKMKKRKLGQKKKTKSPIYDSFTFKEMLFRTEQVFCKIRKEIDALIWDYDFLLYDLNEELKNKIIEHMKKITKELPDNNRLGFR